MFHQNNCVTQSCTIYYTRWFKSISNTKSIVPYLQIVTVFQLNMSFTMYTVTYSHLAKNVPSQNPPSNVNIFSVTTGFLLADIHITKAKIVSNKVRRSYNAFCVQHNTNDIGFCHIFQINATVVTSLERMNLSINQSRMLFLQGVIASSIAKCPWKGAY